MNKSEYRQAMRAKLKGVNPHEAREWSDEIIRILKQFFAFEQGNWAVFYPMKTEPLISPVFAESFDLQFVFPRTMDREMDFVNCSKDELILNQELGILEPTLTDQRVVEKSSLRGILVPGLAFHVDGSRLGKGGGYYDRFLEDIQVPKIGVCYSLQILNEPIPRENHDVLVDYLVSEQGMIRTQYGLQKSNDSERTS